MLGYLLASFVVNPVVYVALMSAVAIIALSYILGEFLNLAPLKGFARLELAELAVTGVIIVIVLLLMMKDGPFDMVAQGFMLGSTASVVPGSTDAAQPHYCDDWLRRHPDGSGNAAFREADFFLGCRPKLILLPASLDIMSLEVKGVLLQKLTRAYAVMMGNELFIGLFSGFYMAIKIPVKALILDIGMMPWISMVPLNEVHTTLVDAVGATWAAVAGQKLLLGFIEYAVPAIFLPFGLLLRAFPFSRKTGSTIIAVCFAAYFIYPISILINEHIWEMIANPQPEQGSTCKPTGQSCGADADCCSLNCRGGKCMTPLTDFSESSSIVAVCRNVHSAEEINENYLKPEAQKQEDRLRDIFSGSITDEKWTKTESRLSVFWTAAEQKGGIVSAALSGLVYPSPSYVTTRVFQAVEVAVTDSMQYTVLVMLFIVNEIVITMTLLKDFALLIGGEPRVFGISKLV